MEKRTEPFVLLEKAACIRCGRCFRVCPVKAISIRDYPEIDGGRCNACGACIAICPTDALAERTPELDKCIP